MSNGSAAILPKPVNLFVRLGSLRLKAVLFLGKNFERVVCAFPTFRVVPALTLCLASRSFLFLIFLAKAVTTLSFVPGGKSSLAIAFGFMSLSTFRVCPPPPPPPFFFAMLHLTQINSHCWASIRSFIVNIINHILFVF